MSLSSIPQSLASFRAPPRPARVVRHVLAALVLLLNIEVAMATEEPRFEVTVEAKEFAVRRYPPLIVAQTDVEGTLDEASSAGFRRIAGYIFGSNRSRISSASEKIAMTAPVTVEVKSEKIAMTAPVAVERAGGRWRVSFVMPASYTLATLPVPSDSRVELRAVPAQQVAVIRFSGLVSDAKVADKTAQLKAWMAGRSLVATAEPRLARYNPPWTLPFLRRNEVLIPCR
jgi:hypothetical protein